MFSLLKVDVPADMFEQYLTMTMRELDRDMSGTLR